MFYVLKLPKSAQYYFLIPLGGPCCSEYRAITGDNNIHFYNVTCNGNENRITNCDFTTNTGIINHPHDVQVECEQGLFDLMRMLLVL